MSDEAIRFTLPRIVAVPGLRNVKSYVEGSDLDLAELPIRRLRRHVTNAVCTSKISTDLFVDADQFFNRLVGSRLGRQMLPRVVSSLRRWQGSYCSPRSRMEHSPGEPVQAPAEGCCQRTWIVDHR